MTDASKSTWDKIVERYGKREPDPYLDKPIPPAPPFRQEEIDRVFDRLGLGHLKEASLGSNGPHTAWVPVLHTIIDRLERLERGDKAD